ncbi:response regulator [Natronomonas gomsonensis]|mgnify:FL=1|jgi:DNA-binding response OmpR family regulator|uniref:response regulator transcription factor n=1 Tax=Natronomonas gomsonensis TaxID=1046043 RepID=UPI0020CA99C4|nr:response regulator [Natronomonas gomsonensis]MCY4730231.1 response regulator [Natronomonas gomsonensis]
MYSILIADDDEEMRELLRFKLQNGYDVTAVADGEECWRYLDENADDLPDLMVLDVMMPGLSGYRILDRMRDDERFDDVEVIMLTSRGREDDIVRALDAGATDYMTKPFSGNELVARIQRVLG